MRSSMEKRVALATHLHLRAGVVCSVCTGSAFAVSESTKTEYAAHVDSH